MALSRLGIRFPVAGDSPDVVRDIGNATADLDLLLGRLMGATIQEGTYDAASLKVTAGAGMTVSVAAGLFFVQDDAAPADHMELVAHYRATPTVLNIAAANATNARVDQIVLDKTGTLSVITGTAVGGETLDARAGSGALPASTARVADVLVPAASASVSGGNIRDRRNWARGAFSRYIRFANAAAGADYTNATTVFAEIDATNLKPRFENKYDHQFRVSLRGRVLLASGGGTAFNPYLNGVAALGTDVYYGQGPASNDVLLNISWDYSNGIATSDVGGQNAVSTGSHRFSFAYRAVTSGSAILRAQSTFPLQMTVEEIMRPPADNT